MRTITSEKSFFGFYLKLIIWLGFYSIMVLMIGGIFFHQYNSGQFEPRNYGLIPLFALLAAGAIYTTYKYFKNAPTIEIDKESITFNHSSTYYWKDLEKAELTGKRSYMFLEEREGVSLKFKDQKERTFLDKMYVNAPEMKTFIEGVIGEEAAVISPKSMAEPPKVHDEISYNKAESVNEHPKAAVGEPVIASESNSAIQVKYFKGSPLLSFDGIVLWGFIAFFLTIGVFGFIQNHHAASLLVPLIVSVIFFSYLSRRFYYFGLSADVFFVNSHYFFWVKNEYPLDRIREVTFEQGHKMPVTLRIINKDFTTAKYPAASLRGKTWLELKTQLEQRNIKVNNECGVSYEPFEFKFFNND